jgi:hypothetical protein
MVICKILILSNMIDDNWLVRLLYLISNGSFNFQLATWLQAKLNVVPYTANDPFVRSNPRDRSKTHSGGLANYVQQHGDYFYFLDFFNVSC